MPRRESGSPPVLTTLTRPSEATGPWPTSCLASSEPSLHHCRTHHKPPIKRRRGLSSPKAVHRTSARHRGESTRLASPVVRLGSTGRHTRLASPRRLFGDARENASGSFHPDRASATDRLPAFL